MILLVKKSDAFIQHILYWTTILPLGLLPIVFMPITQDFYDTNKWTVIAGAAAWVLLLSGIRLMATKSIRVRFSPGVLAFGAMSVAAGVSTIIASTNKVEALTHPLGFVTFASLTILVAASTGLTLKAKSTLGWLLYASAALLGLIAIYQFFGMGTTMFPSISYLTDGLWTPAGSTVSAVFVGCVSIALIVPEILHTIKTSVYHNAFAFLVLTALIVTAGMVLTIWQFLPRVSTSVLPFSDGWMIATKSVQNMKNAAVGVGAENFVSAYTSGKPFSMEATSLWNVRFGTNADLFLHIIVVYGLVGLAATLFMAKLLAGNQKTPYKAARIVAIVCLFLLPPTFTILATVAVLFILSDTQTPTEPLMRSPRASLRYTLGIISVLCAAAMIYGLVRYYRGELYYFQALAAAMRNEGTNTYNLHIQALKSDPYLSRYHVTFSQTNLAIANSVASQTVNQATTGTPQTLSDKDRELTSSLIQQAISEAKVAVTLNTQGVVAWENLANTYQTLMTVAQGSDEWAAAAYTRALALDPTNPILTVNLGGVLVHEQKYDDAITVFTRATLLKPDYANAYYNLANAYKLKGDTVNAHIALQKTLTLVAPNSSDAFKVTTELESLQTTPSSSFSQASEATGSSVLTLPQ